MTWNELIVETIRDPDAAARRMLGWNLPRRTLYEAILAVSALNALLAGISNLLLPAGLELPGVFNAPLAYFVVIAGGLIIMANLFYWAGRSMGGVGEMDDILTFVAWLQGLRALAQIVVLALTFILPGIAALLAIAVSLYGVYVLIQFLKVAHGFSNAMQAVGLLIAVVAGLSIGLMLLLTLAGVSVGGLSTNV